MDDNDAINPQPTFESIGKTGKRNGATIHYWVASEFMPLLGYDDLKLFNKGIQKAIATCASLDIPYDENFRRLATEGKPDDYNLSRFACYLVAMNSDSRKPEVAASQAYFASIAESVRQYSVEAENVERVLVRAEATERDKSLSHTAKQSGVSNYARFLDAGYRGMYNMSLANLKAKKGLGEKLSFIDHMGKTELAAHLFRVTQTEQKILTDQVFGQAALESTAKSVGKEVRQAIVKISGIAPEELPLADNIKTVQRELKSTQKRLKGLG